MNERIKQLATQATRQYSPTYYTQEWIQGFAELIVRECAELFPERHYYYSGPAVKRDIKKHFGVE
jgi:hypothetical protein